MANTGAGTPLTAEEEDTLRRLASVVEPGDHAFSDKTVLRLLATLDAARSRPATDPAGLDAAINALPEMVGQPNDGGWSLVRRKDVLDALAARLSVADGPGPEERPDASYMEWVANGPRDGSETVDPALPEHREETGQ